VLHVVEQVYSHYSKSSYTGAQSGSGRHVARFQNRVAAPSEQDGNWLKINLSNMQ
jgi:hypothetical protein